MFGQPCAEPDGDAEERREADHAGDDADRELAEHDAERIALGVARGVGPKLLLRSGDAETAEHVERLVAAAMRREIARRFRQGEAEHPDDQRADADQQPDAAPCVLGRTGVAAETEHQRGADRPHAGAADEMDDRQDAAADRLRRVFAGIGEGKRLLGAEAEPGDEAADDQQRHARRERAEDREHAEQQQVELIDEPAAEAVAEFTLAGGADEHSEHRGAADGGDFGAGRELRLQDVGNERAEDGEVDDVEEISRGDQRDNPSMQRRYFCFVQRFADKSLNGLSHGVFPLSHLYFVLIGHPIRMIHNRIVA